MADVIYDGDGDTQLLSRGYPFNERARRAVSRREEQGAISVAEGIRTGAVFPQNDIGNDRDTIRAWIEGVRDAGFKHVLAYDHVLSGSQAAHHPKLVNRYDENSPFHEVMVLFGYMAAIAPEMEAATGVVILPQRQAALVAKQAATLDTLTGGRTRLGVGIGWNDIEYQGLNQPFNNRARRMEEQIDLMRRLWQEPLIDFNGEWHTIEQAGLAPLPIQRPIPIWIGAGADVALRRAARLADGFLSNSGVDLERSAHEVSVIREELDRIGRDPVNFGLEARFNLARSTPEQWKQGADWWRQHGMTHYSINTMGMGFTTAEEHLEGLETVRRAIEES